MIIATSCKIMHNIGMHE